MKNKENTEKTHNMNQWWSTMHKYQLNMCTLQFERWKKEEDMRTVYTDALLMVILIILVYSNRNTANQITNTAGVLVLFRFYIIRIHTFCVLYISILACTFDYASSIENIIDDEPLPYNTIYIYIDECNQWNAAK